MSILGEQIAKYFYHIKAKGGPVKEEIKPGGPMICSIGREADMSPYISDDAGEYCEKYAATKENILRAIKQHKDFIVDLEMLLDEITLEEKNAEI